MKLFSFFKKEEPAEREAPEQEEVSLGTKIKVVAALAVVGFATYVAYWVQEPSDYKAAILDAPVVAEETVTAKNPSPQKARFAANGTSSNEEVSIVDFTFTPANLNIEQGTTVVWTNMDSVQHTVSGDAFSSSLLNSGDSFSYTFDQEGTFEYICSIHPQMKGTVTVTAAAPSVEMAESAEELVAPTGTAPEAPTTPPTNLLTFEPAAPSEAEAPAVITFDVQELLSQPPAEDETIMLTLPEEAPAHTAAAEEASPEALAKSGPEDLLYLALFLGILYVNRKRLFPARG